MTIGMITIPQAILNDFHINAKRAIRLSKNLIVLYNVLSGAIKSMVAKKE